MANKTYLDLVNAVARRLRQGPYTDVNETEYSILIGDMINEAKSKVEDAWDWTALRSSTTIETEVGVSRYPIALATKRMRLSHDSLTKTADIIETTLYYQLQKAPSAAYMTKLLTYGNVQNGAPQYWDIGGQDESSDPYIDFYPVPDADTYRIQIQFQQPQLDLQDNDDELLIPELPIILLAWAYMISERGEDGGVPLNEAYNRAHRAMSDAISKEAAYRYDELDFTPV